MMASACVNNVGVPPESFTTSCHPTYGGLLTASAEEPPRSSVDLVDFEFCLDDPVTMLPADELFSDGKLVPLHLTAMRPPAEPASGEIRSSSPAAKPWNIAEGIGSDAFVLSPKAPRCTTRWRELLGLKRQQNTKMEPSKAACPPSAAKSRSSKPFKHLLPRSLKSSADPSLTLPLLHEADPEAVSSSISSRLSLSSSSSSNPEHEDLPRLSLDADKPRNPPRVRISRPQPAAAEGNFPGRAGLSPVRRLAEAVTSVAAPARGVSVDSPRMEPSGRIIFQSLERSSSSPSSLNGVPRAKYRGMERSYSANVRVPSVLNVPVCSLRGSSKSVSVFGFGQLFSQSRKEREGSSSVTAAAHTKNAAAGERWKERPRPRREPACVVCREVESSSGDEDRNE